MPYCSFRGHEEADGDAFCTACGHPIASTPTEQQGTSANADTNPIPRTNVLTMIRQYGLPYQSYLFTDVRGSNVAKAVPNIEHHKEGFDLIDSNNLPLMKMDGRFFSRSAMMSHYAFYEPNGTVFGGLERSSPDILGKESFAAVLGEMPYLSLEGSFYKPNYAMLKEGKEVARIARTGKN